MDDAKKGMLKALGLNKEVELCELGKCPMCERQIAVEEFRDQKSREEFDISGMCQSCQDAVFGG